jgi:hypothetical protein
VAEVTPQAVPPVQQLGSAVLLQGLAVVDVYRLVALGLQVVRQRDGITPPTRLRALERTLAAASEEFRRVSPPRHDDVAPAAEVALSDPVRRLTTAQAAVILGLSVRQVQRLAPDIGTRCGRVFVLDQGAVEAYAAERAAEGKRDGMRETA